MANVDEQKERDKRKIVIRTEPKPLKKGQERLND